MKSYSGTFLAWVLICVSSSQLTQAETDAPSAPWQTSTPIVTNILHTVINEQMAAFRQKDYVRAYGFAATSLHQVFSLTAFQSLVQTHYPIIAQSAKTAFGPSLDNGDEGVVYVQVMDETGHQEIYLYQMVREGQDWKIKGVTLSELPSQTA